jgi:hypothetical protein
MENIIYEDSPLAEFLEGTNKYAYLLLSKREAGLAQEPDAWYR